MDEQLTLHELSRLEAERRLSILPKAVLETAWVRDAQIEAVIDAVLAVALGGDLDAFCHARHVGEWCARIAAALPCGPEPTFARRVGVLCDVDPAALERIVELKHFADYVREYQRAVMEHGGLFRTMSLIVAVAEEFDSRLSAEEAQSPASIQRLMITNAGDTLRPIVEALGRAMRSSPHARVA